MRRLLERERQLSHAQEEGHLLGRPRLLLEQHRGKALPTDPMCLRRNLRHARLRSLRGSHCEPGAQLLEQRLGLSASDRPRPSSEKPRVDTHAVEVVHKGVDARGNQP